MKTFGKVRRQKSRSKTSLNRYRSTLKRNLKICSGINRPWNFGAGYRAQRRKYNKIRTEEKMKIIMGKRQNKDNKIMEKLKAMGIGK